MALLAALAMASGAVSQSFSSYFVDKTLRLDYVLTGDAQSTQIALDELSELPLWAGRKNHLGEVAVEGNGWIVVKDSVTSKVIYKNSFSTLYQEWILTEEAKHIRKGFECTCLIPLPQKTVEVSVQLFDANRETVALYSHFVNPNDVLIRRRDTSAKTPVKYLLRSAKPLEKSIDLVILAEGYTSGEKELFFHDAQQAAESILEHEPFATNKASFNIIAVASDSEESGVSIPKEKNWKKTAFGSHFSTFYSDRYLTTPEVKSIHNLIAGIPYEHIILLANTSEYGGGGIYNMYELTAAHHSDFNQVVVHEFGHSFAGLADEYYYEDDVMTDTYPVRIEPWEANITTLVNFESKWKDMIKAGTPIPTKEPTNAVGLYEGAGYSARGIYRAYPDCRMKTNQCKEFCPVCKRAIQRVINFYTK